MWETKNLEKILRKVKMIPIFLLSFRWFLGDTHMSFSGESILICFDIKKKTHADFL